MLPKDGGGARWHGSTAPTTRIEEEDIFLREMDQVASWK
jgi:hypothetical protein